MDAVPETATDGQRIQLSAIQRRVLGVLVEKGLTTPEYYPLTLKAVIAGCNQRSNRDPISSYDETDVEDCLNSLKALGVAECVFPSTGRTERWRQELGRNWGLDGPTLAVLGELMLRGAQSEGELRSRASRMRPVPDLTSLRDILGQLRERNPPLAIRLTPEGVQRGVRWTHDVYKDAERERMLAAEGCDAPAPAPRSDAPTARVTHAGAEGPVPDSGPAASGGASSSGTPSSAATTDRTAALAKADLERRVRELEERVEQLERRLGPG